MNLGLQNNLSMNANRHYQINTGEKAKAAQKLSSGYRINAAGLSISEKMRQQIRGLKKAEHNIADGTSYVKVADVALAEIQSMMHRINKLSIQASNDTNTAADLLATDAEIQALKKELNQIFIDTEFNTKQIWTTDTDNRIPIGTERVAAVSTKGLNNPAISITETNKWAFPVITAFTLQLMQLVLKFPGLPTTELPIRQTNSAGLPIRLPIKLVKLLVLT